MRILWMIDKLAGSVLLATGFILFWKEWNTPTSIDNMLFATGVIVLGALALLFLGSRDES